MAVSLKHTTQAVGQDAGNGEIGKTEWNEEHTLTLDTGKLLGRSTAGTGAAEEITVGSGLSLTGGELSSTVTASPGGSDTQVQFNDGGAFGGDAGLTFNKTSKTITLGGGTVTTSSPVIDAAQTWNDGAVTFTGLKFNATDTASAAASLLMDIGTGGGTYVSRFKVSKAGVVTLGSGNILQTDALALRISDANGVASFITRSDFSFIPLASSYSWGNASTFDRDLFLTRRAAANLRLGAADVGATTSTVTITIAAPGVVTWIGHSLSTGTPVVFTTTGALPTGITAGTTYYAVVVDGNTFQLASSVANAIAATPTVITTSGTQSGTHTGTRYNITQRLSMQSVTGVLDRLGADLFIQGSQGTGTGAGGSIIFQVAPAGSSGTAQNALATALTINSDRSVTFSAGNCSFGAGTTSNYLRFTQNTPVFELTQGEISLVGNAIIAWGSQTNTFSGSSQDTILRRDAANTLALRNGANAQAFNIYNTYTDASNYERGFVKWSSNVLQIGAEAAGTGTARTVRFFNTANTQLNVTIDPAGATLGLTRNGINYIRATDGAAASVAIGTSTAVDQLKITSTNISAFVSAAGLFQFGGITSSFPALKRSSAALQVRLADDSANAALESASIKTDAPTGGTSGTWKLGVRVAATTTLDTTQYIEVDVGGTLYKLAVVTS